MKRHLDSARGLQRETHIPKARVQSGMVAGLALLLALGCGGTTTFQDTTPIRIAVAPPPPPP